MIRAVGVFCGSRFGRNPRHESAARALGQLLAANGMDLIYGGGHVGLMGAVADAALARGGRVIGAIPGGLFDAEVAHQGLTELHVTEDMHSRKAVMARLSDAFVAMPGGFGTLDELCEIITWAQIGLHRKPVVLLNTDGYWDGFLSFIATAVAEGFIPEEHRRFVQVATTAEEAIERLAGASV